MVGVIADPGGPGPVLGDEQADQVTRDHAEHAEVEERGAQAQQPVLVELRGACGPAELVVAIAPVVADHEHGQADVGEDHPREDPHRRATSGRRAGTVGMPRSVGPPYGDSPTSSSGGPSAISRCTAVSSSPCSGGSVAHTASTAAAHGLDASRSEIRSVSRLARWSVSSPTPTPASTVAANSRTTQR